MATDVSSNKFRTTLHINGGGGGSGSGGGVTSSAKKAVDSNSDADVAVLSAFLPACLITPTTKNDFKCARMEDCFYGDPKLTPPGKLYSRLTS